MRFQVKARIYDILRASLTLELEADTEELARKKALQNLRTQYSESARIVVFAKLDESGKGRGVG